MLAGSAGPFQAGAWAAFWDSSRDGLRLTDGRGRIVAVNPAFCRMAGRASRRWIGKPCRASWKESRADPVLATDGSFDQDRFRKPVKLRLHWAEGRVADCEVSAHPFVDKETGARVLTVIRDNAGESGGGCGEQLRRQRAELVSALAGGVGHDLNNAIAPVLMAASMLQFDIGREDREKAVKKIEDGARRCADKIARLSRFARSLDGERPVTDLREVVQTAADRVRGLAFGAIEVVVDYPSEPTQAAVCPAQLADALFNLGENAVRAMPGGGRVRFTLAGEQVTEEDASRFPKARAGRFWCVRISDNGVGMPPEKLASLFDPFFTNWQPEKGCGLGFPIARGIVKNHVGFITAESRENHGSEFRVYLPQVDSPSTEIPASLDGEIAKDFSRGRGDGDILVVDDEMPILDVISSILSQAGYVPVCFQNSREALDYYREQSNQVALVLSDIMMPGMGGVDLLREMRHLDSEPVLVAFSGRLDPRIRGELHENGIQHFMQKPFNSAKLLETIRAAMTAAG